MEQAIGTATNDSFHISGTSCKIAQSFLDCEAGCMSQIKSSAGIGHLLHSDAGGKGNSVHRKIHKDEKNDAHRKKSSNL